MNNQSAPAQPPRTLGAVADQSLDYALTIYGRLREIACLIGLPMDSAADTALTSRGSNLAERLQNVEAILLDIDSISNAIINRL